MQCISLIDINVTEGVKCILPGIKVSTVAIHYRPGMTKYDISYKPVSSIGKVFIIFHASGIMLYLGGFLC